MTGDKPYFATLLCPYVFADGRHCVFGAGHEVDYHLGSIKPDEAEFVQVRNPGRGSLAGMAVIPRAVLVEFLMDQDVICRCDDMDKPLCTLCRLHEAMEKTP